MSECIGRKDATTKLYRALEGPLYSLVLLLSVRYNTAGATSKTDRLDGSEPGVLAPLPQPAGESLGVYLRGANKQP